MIFYADNQGAGEGMVCLAPPAAKRGRRPVAGPARAIGLNEVHTIADVGQQVFGIQLRLPRTA